MASQPFILLKGQPKGLQIDRIFLGNNGAYAVKFNNSAKTFHYRYADVTILDNAVCHDHTRLKVFTAGREERNVTDVRSFSHGNLTHWRITYGSGFVKDYLHGTIEVTHSCLDEATARNVFEYLKRVAQINELGKDEEHGGILSSLYESIEFVADNLAIAPYLNPSKHRLGKYPSHPLIFPFGCNASQERAVTAAFENQISVIQGPPGTGKTQTILNIIANILLDGKTVMVVSNNNSATTNVLEKLQKYGFGFLVAPLGKRENKEAFIQNQPPLPPQLPSWVQPREQVSLLCRNAATVLNSLRNVFALQTELATLRLEKKQVELEWKHFKRDNNVDENTYQVKWRVKSTRLMRLWVECQAIADGEAAQPSNAFGRLMERIKWLWTNLTSKLLLGVKLPIAPADPQPVITELQALYLLVRSREINARIAAIEQELQSVDAKMLTDELTDASLSLLKNKLCEKYGKERRTVFTDVKQLFTMSAEVCKQYPVVLSTTFSARTSVPNHVFDFIIMDEASQVSIETGALALTCARNAVIVGDTMQLPNVVTEDDRFKFNGIFTEYKVAQGYACADNSFLQSVITVVPDVPQTLLREHYRCHPTIINFCNQRYYGGNLLIMTADRGEPDVMMAVKTVPGHHCRGHYNQREIDVVKQEVLPHLNASEDVGIIAPYNSQVNEFNRQLPSVEAATVHKYQGREKDTIIMSVVDDTITEFSDDPNLINVAISRAKKRFCLVLTGNEQEHKGSLADLVDYIEYNSLTVTESKISSIFDYLYSEYSAYRAAYLAGRKQVSQYDSENLTYALIEDILAEYPEFAHLKVVCHIPLRTVIRDWSQLNDDERSYISHYSTHLDFLIINRVSKRPVLAVETDGYSYHNEATDQRRRDLLKNHILTTYGLPLLRLNTTESNERTRLTDKLTAIITGKEL